AAALSAARAQAGGAPPRNRGAGDAERRTAAPRGLARRRRGAAAFANAREGARQQPVAIGRVVAERAAAEIAPQVEVFQLRARGLLEIAGQEREVHVRSVFEPIEQAAYAGHDPLFRPGPFELDEQMRQ